MKAKNLFLLLASGILLQSCAGFSLKPQSREWYVKPGITKTAQETQADVAACNRYPKMSMIENCLFGKGYGLRRE